MTLNGEKKCDSDELRKGKLGDRNFGWMPRGMGSATATGKCENTSENNVLKDQLQESGVIEVEEEKDLYDELNDVMNEENDELTGQMMDRILDREVRKGRT